MSLPKYKIKAIELRKKGLSYSEILQQVPVAKSTLAVWLQSIGLSKKQEQRLTDKKMASALRGAARKKEQRLVLSEFLKRTAKNEIGKISDRELFLIGIALYWAEGSKQKDHNVSARVRFSNSDINMIKLFLLWLNKICGIKTYDVRCDLYIHKGANIDGAKSFWERQLNMLVEGIYLKNPKNTISFLENYKWSSFNETILGNSGIFSDIVNNDLFFEFFNTKPKDFKKEIFEWIQ